jgi:hypothetical protein
VPAAVRNRPGLARIGHRPGTHATFLEAMRARLSSTDFPALAGLRTRDPADASIALCDTWATAAEVLAFYQDRIANEAYLRTATERRSVLELGRLTGYAPRPGVAASVYLAYDIDPQASQAEIPAGTRVQSVPAAGETMQTFETAEAVVARAEWSRIKVRLQQAPWRQAGSRSYGERYDVLKAGLYFKGIATGLKSNDALLVDYGDGVAKIPYLVDSVAADADHQRTWVKVRAWHSAGAAGRALERAHEGPAAPVATLSGIVQQLTATPAVQPRNALSVERDLDTTLRAGSGIYAQLLLQQAPVLRDTLFPALRSANVRRAPVDPKHPVPQPIKVYALRVQAPLFGHNAPARVVTDLDNGPPPSVTYQNLGLGLAWHDLPQIRDRDGEGALELSQLALDAEYAQVKPSGSGSPSYVVIDTGATGDGADGLLVRQVRESRSASMSIGIGNSAEVSQLTLDDTWYVSDDAAPRLRAARVSSLRGSPEIALLRGTRVHAQSEMLELAPDPLLDDVSAGVDDPEIELDGFHDGLRPGMWMIAAGERADLGDPEAKVEVAERAMIAAVRHDLARVVPIDEDGRPDVGASGDLPGDTLHTFVRLAKPLAWRYRRASFTLYGNVVRATHGETRREVLGAGDATRSFQRFVLKSPPLTHVAAPTPDGTASTLQVRVNKVLWKAIDSRLGAGPGDRVYLTQRDDDEATAVMFGDGVHGARLPSGQDNVTATYRCGLGSAGNLRAGQLTLATDKPLGVKGVTNPMRASGGADADTLAAARANAPLAVTAMDRLVSVADHADFARGFAGIGKAAATTLRDRHGSFVHLTVAGIDDQPIDETSDLFRNLVDALHDFGDPHLRLRVQVREALLLVIQAGVAIRPDYSWDDVQPRVAAALAARFGFQARELGQPLFLSELVATIQGVRGVAHVLGCTARTLGYDALVGGLAPQPPVAPDTSEVNVIAATRARFALEAPDPGQGDAAHGWLAVPGASIDAAGATRPAQIAYLAPTVADSLILQYVDGEDAP